MQNKSIVTERVNLKVAIMSLLVCSIGLLLLYVSSHEDWFSSYEALQVFIREIGILLIVTTAITLIWDIWGKRAFADEILEKARISKEITYSGIISITDTFHNKSIEWSRYIKNVKKIDIMFAYGSTWRHHYSDELKAMFTKKDVRIRVVLPDVGDDMTMNELSRRFGYTKEVLIGKIEEAKKDFIDMKSQAGADSASLAIWFMPAAFHFTAYRFDGIAIMALYSHRQKRVAVPTYICEEGGSLYDYIRQEINAMVEDGGIAKKVYGE